MVARAEKMVHSIGQVWVFAHLQRIGFRIDAIFRRKSSQFRLTRHGFASQLGRKPVNHGKIVDIGAHESWKLMPFILATFMLESLV